jgi:RNA polymerase sigma-70 factor (ECF subfamily)
MSDSSLSSTLFQRLLAPVRDDDAWKRLVDLYGPFVYRRCRQLGVPAEDAADVGQDVFRAVFKDIRDFRREPGLSFRAWLGGITEHKVKDYWRRQAKNPQAKGGSAARDELNQVAAPNGDSSTMSDDAAEKTEVLRRALNLIEARSGEPTWKAFIRFLRDGRSAAEVAAELGMTPGAVHVAVCRVRKRLREEFGPLLEL